MTAEDKNAAEEKNPNEVHFVIDGENVVGKKGQTVLEAGLDNGVLIPHYCWHPGLSISGNCRMCLVNMKGGRKPIIACQTPISDGLEIEAFTEDAKKTREGVMELLLINHPLDCPVCDQAGECDLQEYSFEFGSGDSRFLEAKTQRPNKDLGPLVRFNGNRCILCSRCVRFCDEVTGTGELTIRERGDHNYIDTFPGIPLDNPLSACTTDLCPVGALLDRDFIHKTRVWNLTPTKSVCAGCSTGCNIMAQTWNNEVQRTVPRENQAVNRWWMCDEGRLLYQNTVHKEARVLDYSEAGKADRDEIGCDRAVDLLAENWKGAREVHGEGGVAVIVTGWNTNEELYMALSLMKGRKTTPLGGGELPIACVYAPAGREWESKDGFKINADKNPNREGLRTILGAEWADCEGSFGFDRIEKLIDDKTLKVLLVLNALPQGAPLTLPESLQEKLGQVPYVAVFETHPSELGDKAHLRLPAMTWLEKDGTFINHDKRIQRCRPASTVEGLRCELDVLQDVARRLGFTERAVSSAAVFRRMAKVPRGPFNRLTYNDVGEHGVPLSGAVEGEVTQTGYEAGTVSRARYASSSEAEMIRISVHRGG